MRTEEYLKYFSDIRGSIGLAGFLCTHIPVHPAELYRFEGNIHGHLHSNRVMAGDEIDSRYFCVSLEHINYTPSPLETVIKLFAAQQKTVKE